MKTMLVNASKCYIITGIEKKVEKPEKPLPDCFSA